MDQQVKLLPFQKKILEEIHDPATSGLTVLARGLGLRKVICTLLKVYDGPQNLILLVNATQEDETAIGEQLGIMGCRKPGLRVVDFQTGAKDRQDLYKKGGLISVTSPILVVDMLQSDIPIDLITGLMVLHAEQVTSLSLPAFIIRLFREKNKDGFVKAFTDEPERITSGLFPLKNIMKELQLRSVHIYPRFHEDIKESLERRKADVVELYQPLSQSMSEIHQAIVQCMDATLAELKRTNVGLELDDLTVENAYFQSFDSIVRRQLDPVWHRVGPKTKQLVGDLATLRRLLTFLLTYDSISFHSYLESIIVSSSTTFAGAPKEHKSLWLFSNPANTIFKVAKQRCYASTSLKGGKDPTLNGPAPEVIDLMEDDEDAWAALDEAEGYIRPATSSKESSKTNKRQKWLPKGIDLVMEELPKWSLLVDVLQEIEEEIIRREPTLPFSSPGTNAVLIMCSSQRICELLSDYLSSLDRSAPKGEQGKSMMERLFKAYLWRKRWLNEANKKNKTASTNSSATTTTANNKDANNKRPAPAQKGAISDALKKKDALKQQRSSQRRRIRGGAPIMTSMSERTQQEEAMGAKEREKLGVLTGEEEMRSEADAIADFLATQPMEVFTVDGSNGSVAGSSTGPGTAAGSTVTGTIDVDEEVAAALAAEATIGEDEFGLFYGTLSADQTIIIRSYSDDADDELLDEIKPRYIVMYEPNHDFIRRIECYRSSNPGLGVRVYFMVYHLSCEEHRYLAGLRREKDSFERLIKERGSMLLPIFEDNRAATNDSVIKTLTTRIAGGRQISTAQSQVIVDMREFRSTLPSLLHASKLLVIPATLTVGDYILAPDICVERKSIPDLVSSFNSGRLYTQCELMSVHYKQPILLIEFEENKSFSLKSASDVKSYAKPTGKCATKKNIDPENSETWSLSSIQAKLVLLTLSFPRLRIIWSSSPFATADIFKDLKVNNAEPDPTKAIAVGAEEDPEAGAGVNQAAEELLRSLPGVTVKNVKYVMSKVNSVRELCELDMKALQDILGNEPGKACWEFLHHGESSTAP